MATSTLIQRLPSAGDITFTDRGESHRRQVETFLAAGAIAAGDAVSLDCAKAQMAEKMIFVASADTGAQTTKAFVGIALEAATAVGQRIRVVTAGLALANVAAGNAASPGIHMMISTGGDLVDYNAGSVLQNAAISLEARNGDGQANVIVWKQF